MNENPNQNEWLETDGLGGYATGCTDLVRRRKYHGILCSALTPPTKRNMMVMGFDLWINNQLVTEQAYVDTIICDENHNSKFKIQNSKLWPTWTYKKDDLIFTLELFMPKGISATVIKLSANKKCNIRLRPFIGPRDHHMVIHESDIAIHEACHTNAISWHPSSSTETITVIHDAEYKSNTVWYKDFFYEQEKKRGYEYTEDLLSPGILEWNNAKKAHCIFSTLEWSKALSEHGSTPKEIVSALQKSEKKRRSSFSSDLERVADHYIVNKNPNLQSPVSNLSSKTIIAGYPWFTDWGRDTFIAMRGLSIATGKIEDARSILLAWAKKIDNGMVPNRFTDESDEPEYNSVDASLWFCISAYEYMSASTTCPSDRRALSMRNKNDTTVLQNAIEKILTGYKCGTRYNIKMDTDGLIACGEHGVQLTWMDAKIGDKVITPRIGKPVEIQCLWINALKIASKWNPVWKKVHTHALQSFINKFWNSTHQCLYDVIDCNFEEGAHDSAVRPNQIFAIGGLPFCLLQKEQAQSVFDVIEKELYTPMGLRSLSPEDPMYKGIYEGNQRKRDEAYHQGTVWPWLIGAYIEAWLFVHGNTAANRKKVDKNYLQPFREQLNTYGIGHIAEIADGNFPHSANGCPFQAWSVGEILRISALMNANSK